MCRKFLKFENIHFYQAVEHMKEYMMEADIAISAGGTTLYELCACGTPTITYSFADNQLNNVLQFQEDELMDYAGDVRDMDVFKNAEILLDKYDESVELRKERSTKMQSLVDGKGSERIVKELLKLS